MAEKGLVRVEVVGLLGGADELADLGGTLDEVAAGLVAADDSSAKEWKGGSGGVRGLMCL